MQECWRAGELKGVPREQGCQESPESQEEGLVGEEGLFYRMGKACKPFDLDLDSKAMVGIWAKDLMGIRLGIKGLMVQEYGGANSDPCEPMGSKESMVQK